VIPALDLTIAAVLRRIGLVDSQIGFQPPDDKWRQRVRALTIAGRPAPSVSVYLVDIRENRSLRTNAVHREIDEGLTTETAAPFRVECHYLITAWSAAEDSDQFAATVAEHALLSRILAALAAAAPLNPQRVLSLAELAQVPAVMSDADLPTRVAPHEGFLKLAEFWGTMGDGARWHPAAYLAVTIPLAFEPTEAGGIVDSIIADFGLDADPRTPLEPVETELVVGGVVLDARPPHAAGPIRVEAARVDLLSAAGALRATTTTDSAGEFAFDGLLPGSYRLAYSHAVIPAHPPQPVTVPVASGPVQLVFT
jgi:hypothetical protein